MNNTLSSSSRHFLKTSILVGIDVPKNKLDGNPISFEKGKNQNHLTTEDVEKIVETYKNRETLDKYSYYHHLHDTF
jgi:type I restriction-modification system DNA methylase subunit